jgi:hypothetical protein
MEQVWVLGNSLLAHHYKGPQTAALTLPMYLTGHQLRNEASGSRDAAENQEEDSFYLDRIPSCGSGPERGALLNFWQKCYEAIR